MSRVVRQWSWCNGDVSLEFRPGGKHTAQQSLWPKRQRGSICIIASYRVSANANGTKRARMRRRKQTNSNVLWFCFEPLTQTCFLFSLLLLTSRSLVSKQTAELFQALRGWLIFVFASIFGSEATYNQERLCFLCEHVDTLWAIDTQIPCALTAFFLQKAQDIPRLLCLWPWCQTRLAANLLPQH